MSSGEAVSKPRRARNEEEAELQKRVVGRLRLARLLFCHVPNEGMLPVHYRSKLVALGLESGVPDLLIFTPPPRGGALGFALELKSKKGTASANQKRWLANMKALGWATLLARDHETVVQAMHALGYEYGIPGKDF